MMTQGNFGLQAGLHNGHALRRQSSHLHMTYETSLSHACFLCLGQGGDTWRDFRDQKIHLYGRSKGDTDGKVHLVLDSHKDSSDVFARVSGNGQDDEPQEALVQPRLLAHLLHSTREQPVGQVFQLM